ncbi:UNVERIFIED_CONTAM: hypothetical protein GTU68_030589 [Idotea baltica]|nr:hypothetical protein [Idotea baltica]
MKLSSQVLVILNYAKKENVLGEILARVKKCQ